MIQHYSMMGCQLAIIGLWVDDRTLSDPQRLRLAVDNGISLHRVEADYMNACLHAHVLTPHSPHVASHMLFQEGVPTSPMEAEVGT